ncbi:uncharacterized protein LOC108037794 [Drosophila rhopaloa]|uniref:Uncharacterized protein LOC108037794 n=1 Tax=Drosophila rhopaloa TaxID=1041015 RepID=A0A6P4E3U9_DRORH|nr:uncharacterized protein LOC108037794 [Drosophila rhopaloa]
MSAIENETQWLRATILPEILKNGRLVDNYSDSKADTFLVGDIDIDVIGPSEAFMLTFCYRTTINFEYDGEKFQRKMVVKKTPMMPPDVYEAVQFGALFSNEINFYTEVLPELQKLAGGKFAAPKYYYSELNPYSAVIILENFAEQGWRVTKDLVGLSLEHALIAVAYLGKFHGFAYAMKHKNPQKFAKLTEGIKESRYASEVVHPEFELQMKTCNKRIAKAVATYQPQIDEEFVKKLCFLIADYRLYGMQRVAPREPLATLCHGDYLRNNVAYKYNDKEEPQEIMMFDYQTLRVSSPMIDLSVFLALSIYAEVRDAHFEAIFAEYCLALHESYKKHAQVDVPAAMSRGELLKEYTRFLPYSLAICASFLMTLVEPLNMSPQEMFARQMTDEEIIDQSMKQGGDVVDKEIAHQVKELLELSQATGVSIDDGIDLEKLPKV